MQAKKLPRLTRRSFLAAAGAAALHRTAAARPWLRAGIIGCGAAGPVLAEAMRHSFAPLTLTTVCDTEAGRMARIAAATGARAEGDWRRLLRSADVDAVVVAVPDPMHVTVAQAALACGKPVYLLPPPARNAAEVRALHAAAESSGRLLQVAMETRQDRLWRRAKAALAACEGKPRWIQVSLPMVPPVAHGHWSRNAACGPGPAALHVFNTLYPLQYHLDLGAPRRITALGGAFHHAAHETPDALTVTAQYAETTVVVTCAGPAPAGDAVVLRGPWAPVTLALESASPMRFDLDTFAGAASPATNRRLQAACTVMTALSPALDGLCASRDARTQGLYA